MKELWSILAVPILRMERYSTATAQPPSAPSKAWNVVTFTISLSKRLTVSATARSVHLWRREQVNIRAKNLNFRNSQLTVHVDN